MKGPQWVRVVAYVSGLINQELLLQVEYLAAENQVLRAHLPERLRLINDERSRLAEIGKRLGRKGLGKVASVARPETILAWFRKLVARKFDGSKHRSYPGRPAIDPEVATLIVKMARENSSWGYDRISGALANLGHKVSDQIWWATYYGGTELHLRRSGARLPHGRTSSHHTWRSPQEWTSLPPRFLPGEV